MPPAKRAIAPDEKLLKIGAIVNVEKSGRTMTGYEILDYDDTFIKFRANIMNAPQSDIILVPICNIESLGLCGEH